MFGMRRTMKTMVSAIFMLTLVFGILTQVSTAFGQTDGNQVPAEEQSGNTVPTGDQVAPTPTPVPTGTGAPATGAPDQGNQVPAEPVVGEPIGSGSDSAPLPGPADDNSGTTNDGSGGSGTDAAYQPQSRECQMLGLINDYRASNGLSTLTLSNSLGIGSVFHSKDMAVNDSFSHDLSDGTTWQQNLYNHGYPDNTSIGENIAAGNADAQSTFQQWQNSDQHNAIMLDPDFNALGVGFTSEQDSQYTNYWTADFGAVVDEPVACN